MENAIVRPADLPRLDDWQERLDTVVRDWLVRPYDLATANCCHLVNDVTRAVIADDCWAALGIEPTTSGVQVAMLCAQHGGVQGLAESYFGTPPAGLLTLRTGDVVIAPGADGDSLGILLGDAVVYVTDTGLQRFPLADCRGGWKVGA